MEISISDNMSVLDKDKSPFVESGDCSDEIVFKFDDRNELYVSMNFLGYASPVFKAMFQKGFKEIEERTVRLRDKDYDDMLELLRCIHPAILKPVDRSNALRLLALTDEYQVCVINERCEKVLQDWLVEELRQNSSNLNASSSRYYQKAETSLKILALAITLNQEKLMKSALDVLSSCPFKAITGVHFTTGYDQNAGDPVKHRENCGRIFNDLPDEIKLKILTGRLQKFDNC